MPSSQRAGARRSALSNSRQESAKGSRDGPKTSWGLSWGHPVLQPLQTPQEALAPRGGELGFLSGLGSCPILCLCPSPPLSGLQPSGVKQGGWEVMAEDPPVFCLLGVQVPIHLCLVPHPTLPSVFRSRVRCLVLVFF